MAKRELDNPEGGAGRIAYNPITVTATDVTNTPQKTDVETDVVFKLIQAKWPMFEKLSTEPSVRQARKKFNRLWSELGRDIVKSGVVDLKGSKNRI